MQLGEENKKRIEEEEAYRAKIREEEQYRVQIRGDQYKKKGSLSLLKIFLLIFIGAPFLYGFISSFTGAVKKADEYRTTNTPPSVTQNKTVATPITEENNSKEVRILQEQKAKAENTTKTALNLISEDKIEEAMALYNDRWSELTKLRGEILYDKELTDAQKKNIDKALQGEQESITRILSKYQQTYQ